MHLPPALLSTAMILLSTVRALPSRREPGPLDEQIDIKLRTTVLTQYGALPSPLSLVRVDEPTDDEAVQVYIVEDYKVPFGEGRHDVVARTMKDPSQRIPAGAELGSHLVAYGYDGLGADKRYWLLHVRPYIPRILDNLREYPLTLNWKESPGSDTWTSRDIKLPPFGDSKGGYYFTSTTVDWADGVDVDIVSKHDGSEMNDDEKQNILGDGELVAYGYEAATELYPKRWWLVGEGISVETDNFEPVD